ncbi:peptidoglycan -binding protein [Microvirga arsenatis]|uniref:Peptidoglycan -binding protein n=1 Tax=Microvirga arsenatis TaxID=2692265 RepID=A0ABW9Z493_9HYPH|nr:peptidoglycan -binding protein [Microvirga arsenatis]NBJ12139.1 peptidoglycan -binding protein [Microvirga arsenatis]NBJ25791.1 peptidoglycan -binding protein [Microvirga arsenatis]
MPVSSAGGRRRGRGGQINYWPGFVDALSTLLLAIIFLISVFTVGQFFLSRELSGRDTVLDRLNRQIAELTDLLSLERSNRRSIEETVTSLQTTLRANEAERARLQGLLDSGGAAQAQAQQLGTQLEAERQATGRALSQVEILNQQIAAMRRQLAALEEALAASENRDRESQARIADLGSRLNVALAQRVQELARYRSDFFGRLRQILGNRPDVRIVGDRFVFQSEVLFPAGQAFLRPEASGEIDRIASALIELEKQVPPDIPWVIRVDGHTDQRPINTPQFPSNWALSSARAIAVVQALVARGVQPQHLVAAGFGEFQPLDTGTTEEAYARNRRIELKLTER